MATRRQLLNFAGTALIASALPRPVAAQPWPTRPIRAMIPFTAGSTIDIVGRIVLDPLSSQLGQTIVVENRGGAGGTIGSAACRQGRARRLHDPDQRLSAFCRAGRLSERPLRSRARFFRRHPVRHRAERNGDLAREGHQDAPGSGQPPPRAARSAMPRPASAAPPIGRPSGCASARGFRRRPCAVPRRAGSAHRSDDRASRLLLHGHSSALPFVRDGKLLPLAVSTPKRTLGAPGRADHA